MQRFQGLHVVPKTQTPKRDSTGLEPYLALERKRVSKPHATDPDRFWQVVLLCVIAVVLIVGGLL